MSEFKIDKSLDIDIFTDYKVKFTFEGSHKVGDNEFEKEEYKRIVTKTGGELIEWIINLCKDEWFVRIRADRYNVHIEQFNPNTGETSDYKFEIKVIYDEEN